MEVYVVTMPGGAKPHEFEAYTRLLEDSTIGVSDVPRVPEPDTHRRWLYVWHQKHQAEAFARALQHRTRDGSWVVRPAKIESENRGPVAPLDIYEISGNDQTLTYYLSPASRERVVRAFPHTTVYPLTISKQDLDEIKQQFREDSWSQLGQLITGLSREQLRELGGYRFILPYGKIGHEDLPEVPVKE